uniref:Odorant binding protein n=1 Tax=Eogystia hippophaecolus TaxID=1206364 RepID=A0A1B3P5J3_EOGHI|nr:odorant binding protein [Eogystia hippophaecolus]
MPNLEELSIMHLYANMARSQLTSPLPTGSVLTWEQECRYSSIFFSSSASLITSLISSSAVSFLKLPPSSIMPIFFIMQAKKHGTFSPEAIFLARSSVISASEI